jgi:hypothetical protein
MHSVFLHSLHHMVLSCDDSLQDNIIDAGPKQVHVDSDLLKVLAERSKTPLEAEVVLLAVFVLHEVLILLID